MKNGYYEGAALTEDDVKRYADLESREVLLSKVAGGAKATIARIAQVVDALRVKLEEQEGAAPAAAEEGFGRGISPLRATAPALRYSAA